jgi:hypothetical protein
MHLFGGFGVALLAVALLAAITAAASVARGAWQVSAGAALLAAGFGVAACFAFGLGMIGDLILRTRAIARPGENGDAWPLYAVAEVWRNGRCADSPAGSDVQTRTY